jgi:hypothetical protein
MGLLSVPAPRPAGAASATTGGGSGVADRSLYLTASNLTFPGVAVVAGVILNFLTANLGGNRFWVALAIAVLFGIIVVLRGFLSPDDVTTATPGDKVLAIITAMINTVLLWIAIFGVSSIPPPGTAPLP